MLGPNGEHLPITESVRRKIDEHENKNRPKPNLSRTNISHLPPRPEYYESMNRHPNKENMPKLVNSYRVYERPAYRNPPTPPVVENLVEVPRLQEVPMNLSPVKMVPIIEVPP
jgi:hypothetical protein